MDISDKHILEFQALWKKHFGTEITKEQALEKGLRLVRLIEAVSRVIASEQANTRKTAPSPKKDSKKFNDNKFGRGNAEK